MVRLNVKYPDASIFSKYLFYKIQTQTQSVNPPTLIPDENIQKYNIHLLNYIKELFGNDYTAITEKDFEDNANFFNEASPSAQQEFISGLFQICDEGYQSDLKEQIKVLVNQSGIGFNLRYLSVLLMRESMSMEKLSRKKITEVVEKYFKIKKGIMRQKTKANEGGKLSSSEDYDITDGDEIPNWAPEEKEDKVPQEQNSPQ